MSHRPRTLHRAPQVGLVLEGAVGPLERVYALDRLRDLCECAPEPVRRAQGHLAAVATTSPAPVAIVHCALELEGGTLLVAGAVADTSYDAVRELVLRLRRRLDRRQAAAALPATG
jgi:hypothetical protein